MRLQYRYIQIIIKTTHFLNKTQKCLLQGWQSFCEQVNNYDKLLLWHCRENYLRGTTPWLHRRSDLQTQDVVLHRLPGAKTLHIA